MATSASTTSERLFRIFLRYVGSVSLLALVAVFMPFSWMDATHRWLGLGSMPSEPVVGYLARSLSLFYALQGALLWLCSFDLQRHRPVLVFLGWAFLVFGVVLWGIDIAEGLPRAWRYAEGPMIILFGIIMLRLLKRVPVRN